MGNIYTVVLPDIGEGVMEGEIIEWLKQVGDKVAQDEPVVIVMTDKATVELPAPYPGTLARQHVSIGKTAIKDKPLYDIEIEAEVPRGKEAKTSVTPIPPPQTKVPKEIPLSTTTAGLALPSTRKLAQELGFDINVIQGTGREGRVTIEDLKSYAKGAPEARAHYPLPRFEGDREETLVGIRHLMAKKMRESHQHIPQYSYFEQLDATRLVQLRQNYKEEAEKQGIHVTFMPFIIRALSLSISKFPYVNSMIDEEANKILIHKQQHIGIAISTAQGLIVPVLRNVQEMSLNEIVIAFEALKEKAIEGKLPGSEMKDSTITISNFGVLGGGGQWATPIINFPEVAILGVNRIQKQPIVRNNEVIVRDILHLSWSFDHRIIDGDMAASFSHYFATLLQNPAPLL